MITHYIKEWFSEPHTINVIDVYDMSTVDIQFAMTST